MHARWGAAENEAELAIYPAGVHGFTALLGTLATDANAKIGAFMGKAADGRFRGKADSRSSSAPAHL